MIAGGIVWRYFDQAQRRQGMEPFFDRDVEGTPAGRQIPNDLLGQHHHQGMSPGACFET